VKSTIALKGLEFFAYHGYYSEEQKIGNRYGIDIVVHYDVELAGHEDNLQETVNYESLAAIAKKAMSTPARLLESIAVQIIDEIKGRFPEISHSIVTVRKFNPPIGILCHVAEVTIEK
jgi:7,8-dihydroneopterin aldolase/epimerase/oxygenase